VNSTPKLSVVERAWKYIDRMPRAISGAGGHDATFAVACRLVNGFGLSNTEALELLRRWNVDCQPPWSERDLIHKVRSAMNAPSRQPRGYMLGGDYLPGRTMMINRPKPKPQIDPATAVENYLKGFRITEAELWELSPVRPDDRKHDPVMLLEALFGQRELVNIVSDCTIDESGARPRGYGETMTRDEWVKRILVSGPPEGRGGCWFRINPVDGHGIADANVTSFRYALVEADKLPTELQLSLYAKLLLPIAAILTSGGRSIHCLVRVDTTDASDYRETVTHILRLLAKFGVDQQNKNPSRMSRLPQVQRCVGAEGDGMQRLLYLNPHPEQRRIHDHD